MQLKLTLKGPYPMNPFEILGKLPADPSAKGTLNVTDWKKTTRLAITALIGLALTHGIPYLTAHSWVFDGRDYTQTVWIAATVVAEVLRRVATNGVEPTEQ
jgi:hypothetical protein